MNDNKTRQITFFKLGGTWDMVKQGNSLTGSGNLDDTALYQLEKNLGFYTSQEDLESLELKLTRKITKEIDKNSKTATKLTDHLPWVSHITDVNGQFISLFSGDGSHFRPALIAPLTSFILRYANDHPQINIIAGQGTDTADVALITLLDAYLFDTELLPILLTGANRSIHEWNSDAPKNFSDTLHLTNAHIPTGAYWIFASHLYRASDVIKIDPLETRRIENYSTFFAPRNSARYTKKVIGENEMFQSSGGIAAPKNHISQTTTAENLYEALTKVAVIDLGDMNNTYEEIERITSLKTKAVIIAAHGLGNANNPIKQACVAAAKQGKIVVIISRSLLGDVNERYAASLLGVNATQLMGTGKQVLTGNKMNKNVAKAVVTRAVEENLNQKATQELINEYCASRSLA